MRGLILGKSCNSPRTGMNSRHSQERLNVVILLLLCCLFAHFQKMKAIFKQLTWRVTHLIIDRLMKPWSVTYSQHLGWGQLCDLSQSRRCPVLRAFPHKKLCASYLQERGSQAWLGNALGGTVFMVPVNLSCHPSCSSYLARVYLIFCVVSAAGL